MTLLSAYAVALTIYHALYHLQQVRARRKLLSLIAELKASYEFYAGSKWDHK